MKKKSLSGKVKTLSESAPTPFSGYARCAGILLPVTSLPSLFGIGDLGQQAYVFADFLKRSQQTFWQTLPVNSTSSSQGFSPYGSDGSFAGNSLLISPERLMEEGFLTNDDIRIFTVKKDKTTDYEKAGEVKNELLNKAYSNFKKQSSDQGAFTSFCNEENDWLHDYALYILLKKYNEDRAWNEWENEYKFREAEVLKAFASKHSEDMKEIKWQQYIFHKQWVELKRYCHQSGIKILGDLPFYVAYDSADVWTNQHLFKLDEEGNMLAESGAPPDDFNADGQRWGMPVYRWDNIQKENFVWWLRRMKKNIALFDLLRLDHFRGFSAYWEIKKDAKSAKEGEWKPVPGLAFFLLLQKEISSLPLVAEDLGSIDEPVIQLRNQFNIPGMIIQQVGFGEDMPESKSILHHHYKNAVVYTGNHDNNTTLGWFRSLPDELKRNVSLYTNQDVSEANICEVMSRLVYASVAKLAILPMQDLLKLDEHARMNSVPDGGKSWSWRMPAHSLTKKLEKNLQNLCYLFDRKQKKHKKKGRKSFTLFYYASSTYKSVTLNVSPWFISPVSYPFLNHFIRCADVPCVKASGTM